MARVEQHDRSAHGPSTRESLEEYGRGIAGGLLFSLPLLYTMEMWWFGMAAHPSRLLIYVSVTFALLLAYNRFAGLRRDSSWTEVAIDSVEEIGLGLLISVVMLALLQRVDTSMSLSEISGKVVLSAMTVAIGVSVGTAQLGEDDRSDTGSAGEDEDAPGVGHHIVLAFIGALLIGGNIAPTDEVYLLGVQTDSYKLIILVALSLMLAATVLFYSSFVKATPLGEEGLLYVFRRTVITYIVALAAAAMLLWFFNRYEDAALIHAVSQTIILGVATTLGASAGRLLIQ